MMVTDKEDIPKILIVDDDINHLETLKKLLSKLELSIYVVDSGEKALSLLLKHEFIMILLDVKMPTMGGLETAQLIRENKRSMHIPIIFMTAYDKDELQVDEIYKFGAIDYLLKPINKSILLSKVDMFLRFFNKEKEVLKKEKEAERKKGKTYKELVEKLEEKNKELERSHLAALNIMEDANEARKIIEESQLLAKNQAKDLEQFAYNATHDINTPISNIESFLTFLKEDTDITNEKSLAAIDWIEKAVDQCKRLIDNLVTVLKVKDEKGFTIEEINLNQVLKTVLSSLQPEIQQSGAVIHKDFKKLKIIQYTTPYLESLLLNLISNAIKYRSQDRKLEINVSASQLDEYDCLSVQDNGRGIDVDRDLEKVFALFERANTDTEGIGMGLYLVNETLKKFGHKIELKSEIDKGSTFTVFFKKEYKKKS